MPNLTLSITEEAKKMMDSHPSIKWSSVVRSVIEEKLEAFEEAEKLAGKSRLNASDFESISGKIDSSAEKHAKRLLHESHC